MEGGSSEKEMNELFGKRRRRGVARELFKRGHGLINKNR